MFSDHLFRIAADIRDTLSEYAPPIGLAWLFAIFVSLPLAIIFLSPLGVGLAVPAAIIVIPALLVAEAVFIAVGMCIACMESVANSAGADMTLFWGFFGLPIGIVASPFVAVGSAVAVAGMLVFGFLGCVSKIAEKICCCGQEANPAQRSVFNGSPEINRAPYSSSYRPPSSSSSSSLHNSYGSNDSTSIRRSARRRSSDSSSNSPSPASAQRGRTGVGRCPSGSHNPSHASITSALSSAPVPPPAYAPRANSAAFSLEREEALANIKSAHMASSPDLGFLKDLITGYQEQFKVNANNCPELAEVMALLRGCGIAIPQFAGMQQPQTANPSAPSLSMVHPSQPPIAMHPHPSAFSPVYSGASGGPAVSAPPQLFTASLLPHGASGAQKSVFSSHGAGPSAPMHEQPHHAAHAYVAYSSARSEAVGPSPSSSAGLTFALLAANPPANVISFQEQKNELTVQEASLVRALNKAQLKAIFSPQEPKKKVFTAQEQQLINDRYDAMPAARQQMYELAAMSSASLGVYANPKLFPCGHVSETGACTLHQPAKEDLDKKPVACNVIVDAIIQHKLMIVSNDSELIEKEKGVENDQEEWDSECDNNDAAKLPDRLVTLETLMLVYPYLPLLFPGIPGDPMPVNIQVLCDKICRSALSGKLLTKPVFFVGGNGYIYEEREALAIAESARNQRLTVPNIKTFYPSMQVINALLKCGPAARHLHEQSQQHAQSQLGSEPRRAYRG